MMDRIQFLRSLAAIGLGFTGLQNGLRAWAGETDLKLGYGSLLDDPKKVLNLPKGFKYKIIARAGEKMSDGYLLPGRPDGMACFAASKPDYLLLVRNHENSAHELEHSPFGADNRLFKKLTAAQKQLLYDLGEEGKKPHLGGTTTSLIREKDLKVERCFLSLAGTARNCAGGPTPWGSWLTCEEYTGRPKDGSAKRHGYVFEVKAEEKMRLQKAEPLTAMGRFNHEAVALDPRTGILYLTEDRNDGLFYRFIPKVKGDLSQGGRLQALALVWKRQADTRHWRRPLMKTGINYSCKWIDLRDTDSPRDDLRYRGFAKGAAMFARGEGIWAGNKAIYFACTNGGRSKTGQIFKYLPSAYEGQAKEKEQAYRPMLQVFLEPNNTKLLRYCDNLTVSPWGHIFFCEDSDKPRIFGVSPKGEIYPFAEQLGFKSELAGVCFSPSGQTLFVNIQDAGLSLAIQGPWKTL